MDVIQIRGALQALADTLHRQRSATLMRWTQMVLDDPLMQSASVLSRKQFLDQLPAFLDQFEQRLRGWNGEQQDEKRLDDVRKAAEHGRDRWHQGYQVVEVIREWRHLHVCLGDVLEEICCSETAAAAAISVARRQLTRMCSDAMCESSAQYAQLQKIEAEGRLMDLDHAARRLDDLAPARLAALAPHGQDKEAAQQRAAEQREYAERWREAAHDLRGSLNLLRVTSAVLGERDLADLAREKSLRVLSRGIDSMHALLNDLIDLARLEAGHEMRRLERFDVSQFLNEFASSHRRLASERGLTLEQAGPPSLMVESDPVKLHRILQNLLLNALAYTPHGGVYLNWADRDESDQWSLEVQDSGPGIQGGSASPLAEALAEASGNPGPRETSKRDGGAPGTAERGTEAAVPARCSANGEGIGLSIVKRLCELLDATLELQTRPHAGSTFRVIFPKRYKLK